MVVKEQFNFLCHVRKKSVEIVIFWWRGYPARWFVERMGCELEDYTVFPYDVYI